MVAFDSFVIAITSRAITGQLREELPTSRLNAKQQTVHGIGLTPSVIRQLRLAPVVAAPSPRVVQAQVPVDGGLDLISALVCWFQLRVP